MEVQGVSLVVDFETLGVSRDAVVLAGAAICFQDQEILWKSYQEFEVLQQIHQGSTIDKLTVDWWKRVDPSEFDRLLFRPLNGSGSVSAFVSSIVLDAGPIKEFWSRGYMDFEIFNHHLRNPLEYYVFRDIRTLDSLGLCKMQKNNHNALSDCENELEYLLEVKRICATKQQEIQEEPELEAVGIPLVFPKSE